MKKLLVTGHKGLLGSACCRLLKEKYEIVTVDWDLRKEWAFWPKADYIIHCAAKVGGVKANKEQPVEFLLDNIRIQNNVIEFAHKAKVERLIFIATSCLFPRDAALPVHENSLMTGTMEPSVEAYAIAKLAGWRLCKAYREQYGDQFLSVAPSNIYGPNDNYGPDAHVIPSLMRKMSEAYASGEPMEVWGDGTAVREFIYVDDVVSALDIILNTPQTENLINIGTGNGTSISELVASLNITSPYPDAVKVRWNTSEPTGIPRKTFSIEKLSALGWKPDYNLNEGLKKTWDYFIKGGVRGIRTG